MGTTSYEETNGNGTGQAGPDEDEVMRRAFASAEHRRDTPLNGGFGMDIDDYGERAVIRGKALASFLAQNSVPEGCTVDFIPTLPYSGSELAETVIIKHPPLDDGHWMERPA